MNISTKGPFTYYVSRRRGVSQKLTNADEGGRGVSQMLTIANKGGCRTENFSTKGIRVNKKVDKEGN